MKFQIRLSALLGAFTLVMIGACILAQVQSRNVPETRELYEAEVLRNQQLLQEEQRELDALERDCDNLSIELNYPCSPSEGRRDSVRFELRARIVELEGDE